jgi:hypothetical protein
MDVPHTPITPPAPLSSSNSAEVAQLKAKVAKLESEVTELKKQVSKIDAGLQGIWDKAKSFGIRK